jgi:hypothetical protein
MTTLPKRLTLDLIDIECAMLDYLAQRLPRKTANEILHGVFARGLVALVNEERQKEGQAAQPRLASGLNATGSKIPFAKPKYRPPSAIPEAMTIRLDDEVRDRLEMLLISEPRADIQSIMEMALRMGLDERQKPGALDPAKVFEERPTEHPCAATAASRRWARRLALCRATTRR